MAGGEPELFGQFSGLVRLQAERRVNSFAEDFFRAAGCHLLDVHPAFAAGHNDGCTGRAIHEDGEIKFFFNLDRFGHQHLVDQAPFGPGLVGDQGLPDHLVRDIAGLAYRLAEMYSALESVGESTLAPPAGMDLRFDHDRVGPESTRCFLRLGCRAGDRAARVVGAKFGQQFLGLVFVDIHELWRRGHAAGVSGSHGPTSVPLVLA